jgi:hypothetical protein
VANLKIVAVQAVSFDPVLLLTWDIGNKMILNDDKMDGILLYHDYDFGGKHDLEYDVAVGEN